MATDAAFDWARANIGGFFDKLIEELGTKTVKDVTPSVPIQQTTDPRVMRAYGTGKDVDIGNLTEMMSILPSSASWLLEKVGPFLKASAPAFSADHFMLL